ncbi:MAG: flagellar basal body P-ring formation protein FlgA [Paracoccaceae bacterium]|nr:flagellar basal body P-ring formation protein FlgA [Paracoccaceae bacterium]
MRLTLLLLLLANAARADTVVASHTLRAHWRIGPSDILMSPKPAPGAVTDPADVIGKETRTVIYAGQPIRPEGIGPPALVQRNTLVRLDFHQGGLTIRAEGRALDRGGAGDWVQVMNTVSHNTITGQVQPDGSVAVGLGR